MPTLGRVWMVIRVSGWSGSGAKSLVYWFVDWRVRRVVQDCLRMLVGTLYFWAWGG
jgi:hypothetical protein